MLKRTYDRGYANTTMGEPEAWGSQPSERMDHGRDAPWRRPYGDERSSASDYARRPSRPVSSAGRTSTLVAPATHSDFRNLARSIERLRHSQPDNSQNSLRDRPVERPRSRWLEEVRNTVASEEAARPRRPVERTDPASEREIRRLEALVHELSDRVGRLEETRNVSRFDRARERADAAAAALDAAYDAPPADHRPARRRPAERDHEAHAEHKGGHRDERSYRDEGMHRQGAPHRNGAAHRDGGPRRLWP